MIEEAYVNFETAKLLKEKGFDEPCECAYSAGGQYLLSCYKGIADRRIKNDEALDFSYSFTTPTLQMAMKWLREVHGLLILIEIVDGDIITDDQKYYYVWIYKDRKIVKKKGLPLCYYSTYEEAVEEAIKYCLEKLI